MKLYIVYRVDHEVKVENVKFFSIVNNILYYLVGDDPSAYIVNLNSVATFTITE